MYKCSDVIKNEAHNKYLAHTHKERAREYHDYYYYSVLKEKKKIKKQKTIHE